MDEAQIRQIIRDEIQNAIKGSDTKNQFGVSQTPFHTHNGADSQALRFITAMSDVPHSYEGKAGKAVKVNSTASGLEFGDASSSPAGPDGAVQYNNAGEFGGNSGMVYDGAGSLALSAGLAVGDSLTVVNEISLGDTLLMFPADGGQIAGTGGTGIHEPPGLTFNQVVTNYLRINGYSTEDGADGQSVSMQGGFSSGGGNDGDIILIPSTNTSDTSRNGGFLCIPLSTGTPTGTPVNASRYPMVFDYSANKLWVYNGSWKSVTFT